MLRAIHLWAAKSKANMTALMSLVAVIGVVGHAYLSPAMADKVDVVTHNVAVCGDLDCSTVDAFAIPVS